MEKETQMPDAGVCKYLHSPFPECYCINLTSSNITKILTYCSGDFKICEIYKKAAGKESDSIMKN